MTRFLHCCMCHCHIWSLFLRIELLGCFTFCTRMLVKLKHIKKHYMDAQVPCDITSSDQSTLELCWSKSIRLIFSIWLYWLYVWDLRMLASNTMFSGFTSRNTTSNLIELRWVYISVGGFPKPRSIVQVLRNDNVDKIAKWCPKTRLCKHIHHIHHLHHHHHHHPNHNTSKSPTFNNQSMVGKAACKTPPSCPHRHVKALIMQIRQCQEHLVPPRKNHIS